MSSTRNLIFLSLVLLYSFFLVAQEQSEEQDQNHPIEESTPRWAILPPQVDENAVKSVVEEQMSALHAGDISRAYYAYTSSEFQNATSLEKFKDFVGSYSVLSKNKSLILTKSIVHEGAVTFQGTVTSADGAILDIDYDLVKEDNDWKIIGIHLHPTIH